MTPTEFVLIGSGWRADFYLRVAEALPERLRAVGALVRNASKGEAFERRWGITTYRTLDDLLNATSPRFAVVSTPWAATPTVIKALVERDVPTLAETPPAPDLAGLSNLHDLTGHSARVQVAEQYLFQPLHAARLELVRSGLLGPVSQAQVSVAHGYHGTSLMRALLGVGFKNASITARAFTSKLVEGPGREGPPEAERVTDATQVIAQFDFGDQLGLYDFTGEQYFSWIRAPRLLVRGERGELSGTRVRYLVDFRTPIELELSRRDAGHEGNLEGYHHQGVSLGDRWLYRNPFAPARLSDEELAVATCLEKMSLYAQGGAGFYSLAEASQDHYLSLMMERALESASTVRTETQPWAA